MICDFSTGENVLFLFQINVRRLISIFHRCAPFHLCICPGSVAVAREGI